MLCTYILHPECFEASTFDITACILITSWPDILYFVARTIDIPNQSNNIFRWKIFELDGCEGSGKACLVFPPKSEGAQVPICKNQLDH